MASSSSSAPPSDAATEAAQLEELINETLRRELQSALDARDKLYEKIAACMELRTNCQQLLERGQRELKTMVNLGSDFYVQAHVPDTGWIYVDVGLGFHAQMTLDEACAFATKREAALNARAEELTARATRLKARIKLALYVLDSRVGGGGVPIPGL